MFNPHIICKDLNSSFCDLMCLSPNLISSSYLQANDSEYRAIKNLNFVNMFRDSLTKIGGEEIE